MSLRVTGRLSESPYRKHFPRCVRVRVRVRVRVSGAGAGARAHVQASGLAV